jgi:hypothetical protein
MVLELGRDKKPHVSVFTLNNGFGARIILEALQPYAFCLHTHGLIINFILLDGKRLFERVPFPFMLNPL